MKMEEVAVNWAVERMDLPAVEQIVLRGVRFYNPVDGRFISKDPMGFNAGDTNLYRYVGNHPTDGRDPTGLFTLMEAVGAMDIAAALLAIPNSRPVTAAKASSTKIVNITTHLVNQPGYTIPHWNLDLIRSKYFAAIGADPNGRIKFAGGDELVFSLRDDVIAGGEWDETTRSWRGATTTRPPGFFDLPTLGWLTPTIWGPPCDKNWHWGGILVVNTSQSQWASTMDKMHTTFNPERWIAEEKAELAGTSLVRNPISTPLTEDEWAQVWANMILHEQVYLGAYGGSDDEHAAKGTIESGEQNLKGGPLSIPKPWWDKFVAYLRLR